jgi:hypothetical protein
LCVVLIGGACAPGRANEAAAQAAGGRSTTDLLHKGLAAASRWEIVEMVKALTSGSSMGPGDGWFHPGQSRYDWKWLAARHGIDPNGRIARKDFKGPAEWFDRLDRNRDGVLTAADLDGSDPMALFRQPGPLREWFALLDANRDGRITRAEWEAFFNKVAKGKDHFTPEDLKAVLPAPVKPAARPAAKSRGMPSPLLLLSRLATGELGSPLHGPRVDQLAPDFTLKTFDGKKEIRLSEYRGHKPVVLVFGSFT